MNWPKLTVSNPARQFKRISYPPELVVTCEGAPEKILVTGPDISVNGMFINTRADLPEGTVLNITFRLAKTSVKVSVRGEVRYRVPGIGVGVEFVNISTEARLALEKEFEQEQ
jgi:PilZ domain